MSTAEPIIINGKRYLMWESFVHGKEKFIGRMLTDLDSDPFIDEQPTPTKLIDITLKPNGKTSAMITFVGLDYSWSCDVEFAAIRAEKDVLFVYGYGSMMCSLEMVQ